MNVYVQNYLEKRNAQKKEELAKKIAKIVNEWKIGEKEYPQNSAEYNKDDYPYWDPKNQKYYRYNAGEITEEEYNLLMQDLQDPFKEKKNLAPRSDWYQFASVILVLSCIGLFVLAIVSVGEENPIYFLIGLGETLIMSIICGILQLLACIKQGIDNINNKM